MNTWSRIVVLSLVAVVGCGSSAGEWESQEKGEVTLVPKAKGYGTYEAKKASKVRLRVTASGPVDAVLRLYKGGADGKHKELATKKNSSEFTLDVETPADKTVQLVLTLPEESKAKEVKVEYEFLTPK